MMFSTEGLSSMAVLVFGRERIVTVLCNSPLHAQEVAVVELFTSKENLDGAVCLRDLVHFAGLVNLNTNEMFVREQSSTTLELWLYRPKDSDYGFDDVTPTDITPFTY